jgi:aminoglycoside phosphotransferase
VTTPELAAPQRLADTFAPWAWTPVSCYPHQTTWRLDRPGRQPRYAKVARTGTYPDLRAEAARTQWARAHRLPVPAVIGICTDGHVDWLVTSGIPGRPATEPTLGDPATVVAALAHGLRRFHQLAPVRRCPFDFRLPTALDHVGDPQFSQTPATVVTRYVTVVMCALDRHCRDSSFGPSEVGSVGKVVVTVD